MPRYLLSVFGAAEQTEFGGYASRACRGAVEVRPFHTQDSVRALHGS